MCFRVSLSESDIPTVPLGFRYKHQSENRSQKKTQRESVHRVRAHPHPVVSILDRLFVEEFCIENK